jgi:translation elongation factor EF-Tu-like GTPase
MSNLIHARVRFLTTAEGGRSTPARSGVRPHLRVGDVFTTCILRSRDPDEVLLLGRDYELTLEIVFWEEYGHLLKEVQDLELFEGNRLVARGEVLASPFTT